MQRYFVAADRASLVAVRDWYLSKYGEDPFVVEDEPSPGTRSRAATTPTIESNVSADYTTETSNAAPTAYDEDQISPAWTPLSAP